ncbi:ammonium transporter [Capsaspora owczarzaki ATCC 30864]|uniref:Ammonium transporter n=1 Tax=Capsaspora owczarzaki (strain ATCC 30864) TaxID=595528 RepID=A0A0D2VKX5_CAPO3|nr:ammonium transporter [Capsaspora owczarzaki ATCC 30864]KJE90722.1 ammonium transporter, variant [Capsaspora owczarzaki ATCC 30864]|eukprot:XP_004364853.2 ammonium transporter [Capsaspora owczarzaki ATCC 30864]
MSSSASPTLPPEPAAPVYINALMFNTVGYLFSGMLIFLMQLGFALLEAGAVRAANATNITLKNTLNAALGMVCYWVSGFGLSYGGGNKFIGSSAFFLLDLESLGFTEAFAFCQLMFALTSSTIMSGSMAERTNLVSYCFAVIMLILFVYPVVVHWCWSDWGWLSQMGYIDHAGSSVVHATGGCAALLGALMVGPRIGRFGSSGQPMSLPGHSTVLVAQGALLLWVGFFAFNICSGNDFTQATILGHIAITTTLSGAFAALAVLLAVKAMQRRWSLLIALNAVLAGLVAICSGCATVPHWAAVIIGAFAGLQLLLTSHLMVRFKIDDPLDAIAVHLGGGIVGTIGSGLFAREEGLVFTGDFSQLGIQLLGILCVCSWTCAWSFLVFFALRRAGMLRVSEKAELEGLDVYTHREPSYPEFMGMRRDPDELAMRPTLFPLAEARDLNA